MNYNRTPKSHSASNLIIIHEDFERRYWTAKLNCTNEELKQAFKQVGFAEDKVAAYLQALKSKSNQNIV